MMCRRPLERKETGAQTIFKITVSGLTLSSPERLINLKANYGKRFRFAKTIFEYNLHL